MNDLVPYARRINDREKVIEELRAQTVGKANETLCEVLLQGQDLLKVKASLPHGSWLTWLRAHCPKLSERRAQRYMALAAKAPGTAALSEADSLRHALALCDMEGEREQAEPRQWPAYLEAIGRLTKLAGYVKKHPIEQWPQEGVERCREELLPLASALWPDRFV